MDRPYALHWFRRDLRLSGNPALKASWKQFEGRVLGVFCFDKKFLARPDFSVNRFQFFLETLASLKVELAEMGTELLVLDVGPDSAFEALFSKLKDQGLALPKTISWNRDYEPFARERDGRMKAWFESQGVKTHTERDHVLIEPQETIKASDPSSPFQIYTPFSRNWLETFRTPEVQKRVEQQGQKVKKAPSSVFTWETLFKKGTPFPDVLETYRVKNRKRVTVPIPKAGTEAAQKTVKAFQSRIKNYGTARDIPSLSGTSHFSIFFKNGSLTIAQVIAALGLKAYSPKATTGEHKFLSELIWREFYYYILFHFPLVERESFNPKYRKIRWENREDYFEAWKAGRTGFPIVDAGMRQLKTTGWMHNRVRMIVASFLTKDLLVSWQWGEQYFMEQLLDGDLAPNNGGWQWSASTGCDPQPYFRIFNPLLQSQKFDPEGEYIKTYVPELRHLSAKDIHCPPALLRGEYPQPIVDHSEQREKAIRLFK